MKNNDIYKPKPNEQKQGDFKDCIFSLLQAYGDINQERGFDVRMQGKKRKHFLLSTSDTKVKLINILKEAAGFNFFLYAGNEFKGGKITTPGGKREIFYASKEFKNKGFFLNILHEVGYGTTNNFREGLSPAEELKLEEKARSQAIQLATTLKNTHRISLLDGFESQEDVYGHIEKFLKNYTDPDGIKGESYKIVRLIEEIEERMSLSQTDIIFIRKHIEKYGVDGILRETSLKKIKIFLEWLVYKKEISREKYTELVKSAETNINIRTEPEDIYREAKKRILELNNRVQERSVKTYRGFNIDGEGTIKAKILKSKILFEFRGIKPEDMDDPEIKLIYSENSMLLYNKDISKMYITDLRDIDYLLSIIEQLLKK